MRSMRRKRRRNNFRQKTNVNFTVIIVIMCMAVILGYGTAKFVIYPMINGDLTKNNLEAQQQSNDNQSQTEDVIVSGSAVEEKKSEGSKAIGETSIIEDGLSMNQATDKGAVQTGQAVATPTPSGYCIQFGSFSTKLSADNLVSQLKTGGITAEILEKDGSFKVVSQLFPQKDQAVATLNSMSASGITDAFITPR